MTRSIPALAAALAAASLSLTPALAAVPAAPLPDVGATPRLVNESIPGSHPHRGGGRHHGASSAAVSATTPDLKGTSREEADKEYRKKYGF